VEQGFSPAFTIYAWKDGFQPLRYVMVSGVKDLRG
jgi:hypothetical protein